MADLVAQLLDGMKCDFPRWQEDKRPIHTRGVTAVGTFRGTPEAQRFCGAEHFSSDWTPVTVRFSNGAGQEGSDADPDVRGMAVKFHTGGKLPTEVGGIMATNARDTDLVCMSAPMFMVRTAEELLAFEKASVPRRVRRLGKLARLKLKLSMIERPQDARMQESSEDGVLAWARGYSPSHAFIQYLFSLKWIWSQSEGKLVPANPPASYTRMAYHAVHAFKAVGNDQVKRRVRFTFEPANGVRVEYRKDLANDYLRTDLEKRLARFPVRFNLRMYIADPWDDTSDPTSVWPNNRQRILMGTLELLWVVEDQAGPGGEKISFNPGRLPEETNGSGVPYLAMSDDPVLAARVAVYNASQRRRKADLCPVAEIPVAQQQDSGVR